MYPTNEFLTWCEVDISFPFVPRHLRGPLSIQSNVKNVKQTVLSLTMQYNTASRSTWYISQAPEHFCSHRSRQKSVHLLQTEYKQQPACTRSGSLLYSFNIIKLWLHNFMSVLFMYISVLIHCFSEGDIVSSLVCWIVVFILSQSVRKAPRAKTLWECDTCHELCFKSWIRF